MSRYGNYKKQNNTCDEIKAVPVLCGGIDSIKPKTEPERLFEMVSGRPYELKRKKLYKGKFAPVGSLFLIVSVYEGKRKISSCFHIKGNQTAETEFAIAEKMFENILNKASE